MWQQCFRALVNIMKYRSSDICGNIGFMGSEYVGEEERLIIWAVRFCSFSHKCRIDNEKIYHRCWFSYHKSDYTICTTPFIFTWHQYHYFQNIVERVDSKNAHDRINSVHAADFWEMSIVGLSQSLVGFNILSLLNGRKWMSFIEQWMSSSQ